MRVPSSFTESNYSVSSYRVAHVLPRNRPRGKWKSKKLAVDCASNARNVKLLRKSREIVTDLFPFLWLFSLAGQFFNFSASKRDTVSIHTREQTSALIESTIPFLNYDINNI